jgi:cystathionine gamma-synthase
MSLLVCWIAFKYPDPSTNPIPFSEWDPLKPETKHIYSRYTQNVSSRAEQVLSRINVRFCFSNDLLDITLNYVQNGYALTYSSGLASGYAVSSRAQASYLVRL